MKITIKKNTNKYDAIKYLTNFINNHFEEYQNLENDMKIYLTLKNEENEPSPDNEEIYILEKDGCVDVLKEQRKIEIHNLKNLWIHYLQGKINYIKMLETNIEKEEKTLIKSKEKNVSKKNIQKKEIKIDELKTKLENNENFVLFLNQLNKMIEENKAKIYIVRYCTSSNCYKYTMKAYYIFTNVKGKDYYFDPNNGIKDGNIDSI